jgi:hypothetical protein
MIIVFCIIAKKSPTMNILVNSDKNINVSDAYIAKISGNISEALSRFSDNITRIEVFLADENSERKGSDDKRCTIEVREKGAAPEAVTSTADDIDLAIKQATDKVFQLLWNRADKAKNHS